MDLSSSHPVSLERGSPGRPPAEMSFERGRPGKPAAEEVDQQTGKARPRGQSEQRPIAALEPGVSRVAPSSRPAEISDQILRSSRAIQRERRWEGEEGGRVRCRFVDQTRDIGD